MRLSGTALLAALLATAPALGAQVVRGTVVDSAGGTPVPGAVVRLVPAEGGAAVDESAPPGSVALTDERGRFVLRAPVAGRWVVEAKRIGVRPARSAPLDLAAGESREVALGVAPVTTRLTAVRVLGDAQCAERVASADETATLWEEVRAALTATRLTRESGVPTTLTKYRRRLNPRTGDALEARRIATGPGADRFASESAEWLSAHGWIVRQSDDGHVYHAPDAAVLLAAAFVRDHCFRPMLADTARELVGLAFEPAAHRKLPDISGVLWLDARSHELRRLDYRYTQLPHGVRYDGAGGFVEFERVPTGAWIVRRWAIRMPEVAVRAGAAQSAQSAPTAYEIAVPDRSTRPVVTAVIEEGGEATLTAAAAPRDTTPAIAGVVWDSSAARPLAGARVSVEGMPYAATTDGEGRYRLLLHRAGAYTLTVRHPRVDTLGVARPRAPVTVGVGEAQLDLALPSASTAALALCPGQPPGTAIVHGRALIVGAVPDRPELEVRLLERARVNGQYAFRPVAGGGRVAVSGPERRYVLCALPAGTRLRAVLRMPGGAETDLELNLRPGEIAYRDLVLQGVGSRK